MSWSLMGVKGLRKKKRVQDSNVGSKYKYKLKQWIGHLQKRQIAMKRNIYQTKH